jgi:hypothetical protein
MIGRTAAGSSRSTRTANSIWARYQFQTFLHARIHRVECPTPGVKQVAVPWADARARLTALMERPHGDGRGADRGHHVLLESALWHHARRLSMSLFQAPDSRTDQGQG